MICSLMHLFVIARYQCEMIYDYRGLPAGVRFFTHLFKEISEGKPWRTIFHYIDFSTMRQAEECDNGGFE